MITTMAYQRNPDNILWATLSDGNLISMTYDPKQNVIAWARHPMPLSGAEDDVAAVPEVPAVPSTYKYTYISENSGVWGVPFSEEGTDILTLDADGVAVDRGGGIVGLPYAGNPFIEGDIVRIVGTTNYDGTPTLTSGTSASEIRFTDGYGAETFDGTESVVKYVGSLPSGAGHAVADSSGNVYYGHKLTGTSPDNYYVTRINIDGTIEPDYLWININWNPGSVRTIRGMGISDDDAYLYLWILLQSSPTAYASMLKFNLSSGDKVWESDQVAYPGYDMDIDSNGNAYATALGGVTKFASADGSRTLLTSRGPYNTRCFDALGIVVTAGTASNGTNIYASTYNGSDEDGLLLGTSFIGTGSVDTDGTYIYAQAWESGVPWLYKMQWSGSSLSLVSSSVCKDSKGIGLYVDPWGNLVVVSQTWISSKCEFYIYDSDLNHLSTISNVRPSMLRTWASSVGGAWLQGDAMPVGTLGTAAVPGTDAVVSVGTAAVANSVTVIPGDPEDEVWVSVSREINGDTKGYIERMKPRKWGSDMNYMFFVDSGLTYDDVPTTSITGLDHLEGEVVAILGNGAVLPTQTVADGAISLAESVAIAQVGLPFTYKLKPMRMDQNTRQGTSKGSIKKFAEAVVSFKETLNAKYGDGIDYHTIPWRETSAEYTNPPDLVTGDKVIVADGGFNVEDPIEITGNDPMPCTVRAIIPRIEQTGR